MIFNCYVCDRVAELSPRSRCVMCEYKRALANEEEVESLRRKYEGSDTEMEEE